MYGPDFMMGAGGLMWAIFSILLLIEAVLLFFLPFFVYRIRNEAIEANKKMEKIIKLNEQSYELMVNHVMEQEKRHRGLNK